MAGAKSKRCYFDLADMIKANATGYFPYTPALPMLYGLRESLNIIYEEGLENIFPRHHYLAEGVRAAILEGWKLEAVRESAEVVFGHGERDRGARGYQRGARDRRRLPAL